MSIVLIEKSRGKVVESIFRGDIAIVANNKLAYYAGDPYKYTYMRSCAKPIQALNVLLSGAAENYNFTEEEVAIMCASHYGEEKHRRVVESILAKIGLDKTAIKGGVVNSLSRNYADQVLKENIELNELFSDCSGKHAGKLATCRFLNLNLSEYLSADHPLQHSISAILAELAEYPILDIEIGLDGCSAPVHALPLVNMAKSYEKFAGVKYANTDKIESLDKIFTSMCNFPFMVSGSNGFCTDLIKAYQGVLIGKIGAEGVYMVAIKVPKSNKLYKEGVESLGIAIKMEDGNMDVLPVVVMEVLKQLCLVDKECYEALKSYITMEIKNDLDKIVGYTSANFLLQKWQ